MKAILIFILASQFLFAANKCEENFKGDISPQWIKKVKQKASNKSKLKQRMNDAVRSYGLSSVSQSQKIIQNHNSTYTNMSVTGTINNQQQSGRCWIFAGTNTLRSKLIKKGAVARDFDFSQAYLHFYSQLERTNMALEEIIKKASHKVSDRSLQHLLQFSIGDGGYYEDFAFLVEKYGLVPSSAMPDHFGATSTGQLRAEITEYVQKMIDPLWQKVDQFKGNSNHVSRYIQGREVNKFEKKNHRKLTDNEIAELRDMKQDILAGVWEILETHLGTPPDKFNVKFYKKETPKAKKPKHISKSYTPLEFARNFVNYRADDYVTISSLKSRKVGKVYKTSAATIGANHPKSFKFLNVEHSRMLELLEKSIDAGSPSWVAAQFGPQTNNTTGIMHPEMNQTDGIYEFQPNSEPSNFTPIQGHYYWKRYANHAVVIDAYDKPINSAQTVKYRVQNSWSSKAGDAGYYHMYREWAQEHLYEIIIPKNLLTAEELELWNSRPKMVTRDAYFK